MELIKIIDGEPKPYSFAAFRAANKHTVYGVTISNRHLNAQDVYRVSRVPKPEAVTGQKAVRDARPTQDANGSWVLGWTLAPLSQSELDSDLANWRGQATLYRRDFCIALKRAGILPVAEAIAAAKGDWPTTFEAALSALTQDEQDEAQIEWASVVEIRRNHPMIVMLGAAAGMTDVQVDALFGRLA
jgi:hypothetical protein